MDQLTGSPAEEANIWVSWERTAMIWPGLRLVRSLMPLTWARVWGSTPEARRASTASPAVCGPNREASSSSSWSKGSSLMGFLSGVAQGRDLPAAR